MNEKIFQIKQEFLMWGNQINRTGINTLLKWLDESGFYKAPASTKYHLSKEGGLAQHSVNVCCIALKLNRALGKPVEEESLILVSLFHDLGKHMYFKKHYYVENILKSGNISKAKPYISNKELIAVPHEVSSVHILSQFIELTEEETWAILQHNGMYGDLKYRLQGNETQLQMILHWADMWASRILEKGEM